MNNSIHSFEIDDFGSYFRGHGLAATHQRMAIFQELANTKQHPDAETIYKGVRTKLPSISLDTVYRTLRTFEDKGMIMRVTTTGERARYDAETRQHSHFVCTKCGMVADMHEVDSGNYNDIESSVGTVSSVCVEFRGICKNCQNGKD
jgi:Fur family peroxide stress response transcriptional regulator